MKKASMLFASTIAAAALLTGCGTSDDDKASEKESKQETTAPAGGSESTAGSGSASKTDKDSANDSKDTESDSVRTPEKNLAYTLDGKETEKTAFLKTSDNQQFSMYVLPEYELTAEEPSKDSLMLTSDEQIFMRIEILPADSNWDGLKHDAQSSLASISENVTEADAAKLGLSGDSIAYETTAENDRITAVLLHADEVPVKLTIFTPKDRDRSSFIKMAQTIKKL